MKSSKVTAERILRELPEDIFRSALDRWRDGTAFGWRARRCAEAMLLVLVAEHAPERLEGLKLATLDVLLTQDVFAKGKRCQLPRDFRNAAEGVKQHGNALAHVQVEDVDVGYNASLVAAQFRKLIEEYYELRGEEPPEAVREAIAVIEDPSSPISPERARARLEEFARARPVARRRSARALAVALGTALAGLAAGTALGMNLAHRATPAAEVPSRPAPTSPPATDVPITPVAVVDAAVVANDAPPSLPPCPEGSVAVPPMRFHLRAVPAEDRPTWPAPVRAPAPTERSVDGFCLQRRPLTRAEVARLDRAIPMVFPSCRRDDPAPDAAFGCLSRTEAERLCAQWAPGGRLPTSLEWEAIVRASAESPALRVEPWRSASVVPDSLEWTADPFPAPWLARGDARPGDWMTRGPIPPSPRSGDHAWNSWNHHVEGRVHNIYVRCAVSR